MMNVKMLTKYNITIMILQIKHDKRLKRKLKSFVKIGPAINAAIHINVGHTNQF